MSEVDKSLTSDELEYKMNKSKGTLNAVNPDFLIGSLDELPRIIKFLNHYK